MATLKHLSTTIVFLSTAAFLLSGCSGSGTAKQNEEKKAKNSLADMKLHGKVKSYTENAYDIKFGDKDKVLIVVKYLFDENGNEIEEVQYDSTGIQISRQTTKYDADGNDIEILDYGNDGKLARKIVSNPIKGNKEKVFNLTINDTSYVKSVEKLDDRDNIIESTSYFKEEINSKVKYKYNDKDEMTGKEESMRNGELLSRYEFTYDTNGNNTGFKEYNVHGNLVKEQTKKYDKDNNCIEIITENKRPRVGEAKITKLVSENFDTNSNATKKTFYKDNKAVYIYDIKIEYY